MDQKERDKILIDKIAGGDDTAFEEFVICHQGRIINLIYKYTRSREDAEELAQDVFVSVWEAAGSFRGRSSVSTWLYRIAVNASINHVRKRRIRAESLDKPVNLQGGRVYRQVAGPVSMQPDSMLEQKTDKIIIEKAMEKLAPNQKMAFMLSKYENHSYAEIAEIMKLSVSSVESLLFRAKQNLKIYLVDHRQRGEI